MDVFFFWMNVAAKLCRAFIDLLYVFLSIDSIDKVDKMV